MALKRRAANAPFFDIYTVATGGGDWRQLTDSPQDDRGPEWSPDGNQLVFASESSGNYEIYTMDADGQNQRRLTQHPGEDRAPAWHPDGDRILFTSDRDGNLDLYVMDVDGAQIERLTYGPSRSSHADWSPDGSKICYRYRADYGPELRVMNADGSEQRTVVGAPYKVGCTAWIMRRCKRVPVGATGLDAGFDPPLGARVQGAVVVHDQRSIRSAVGITARGGSSVRLSQPAGAQMAGVEAQSSTKLKVVESIWMGQPTTVHLRHSAGVKQCRIIFDPTTGRVADLH